MSRAIEIVCALPGVAILTSVACPFHKVAELASVAPIDLAIDKANLDIKNCRKRIDDSEKIAKDLKYVTFTF